MTIAEKLRQEGMEKGLKKTAKNMINRGMPDSDIEELTGLSLAEIQKLKKEAKPQSDSKNK